MFLSQRKKVLKEIADYGIELQIPSHLPSVNEKIKKSAKETAERITQLYSLIGLTEDEVDNVKIKEWLKKEGLFNSLDTEEQSLFDKKEDELTQDYKIKLSWLRESLFALAWSINLVDSFPLPNEEVTLTGLFAKMPPSIPTGDFCMNAKFRKAKEIFFQLDLYYCLNWLIVEHGEKGFIGSVKKGIVIERRLALEWLVSDEPWNEITLDT